MKTLVLAIVLLSSGLSMAQSAKEIWQPILSHGQLAQYFEGMWERLGVSIEETGEELTVVHKGDHFELLDGIQADSVDYIVEIKLENLTNMAGHGADGVIDEKESFRIMSVLFTPFVQATLEHPMMNKSFQMKLVNIENHIHVYLHGPSGEESASHTMIFINKKWLVVEGIHGEASRVFHMTVEQAIEYQREAFLAQKLDTRKSWKAYKKFYLKWRKGVSEAV